MTSQIPVSEDALAAASEGRLEVAAPDLSYRRLAIVNVILWGQPDAPDGGWVLVDAGLPGTADVISAAAEERFGAGSRPPAIIMTHAHFDHVGAVVELAEKWDVPVYAHPDEMKHLDGSASYPPPDPSVGGGAMAWAAKLYPRGPVDLGARLRPLPANGTVPHMPGWHWLHTPGHTEGHVSLWREGDRSLIAGDAFITTAQESAYAVAVQEPELHGPPMYFTPDWTSSKASVERLAALEPELVLTGHGPALRGPEMRAALARLAKDFDEVAVPKHGRYIR